MPNEQGQTLGEFLRGEREKRDITIEQVASATKVGVKTLLMLESDQYAELPARPFILGFVQSYARFIGLDPKEVVIRFGDFIAMKSRDRPNRDGGHSGYAFEKREGDQSRAALWIVMGIFLVAGGGAALFVKRPFGHHAQNGNVEKLKLTYGVAQRPGTPIPLPTSSSTPLPAQLSTLTSAPAAASTPAPAPVAVVLVPPSPILAPKIPLVMAPPDDEKSDPLNSGVNLKVGDIQHRVVFKANEAIWIRYQVDGRPKMTFPLLKGKVLVLRAKESICFQVSNASAVTYSYRGAGYKPLLGDQRLVTRQSDATIFFPQEIAHSLQQPFPGESPLTGRAAPISRVTPAQPAQE